MGARLGDKKCMLILQINKTIRQQYQVNFNLIVQGSSKKCTISSIAQFTLDVSSQCIYRLPSFLPIFWCGLSPLFEIFGEPLFLQLSKVQNSVYPEVVALQITSHIVHDIGAIRGLVKEDWARGYFKFCIATCTRAPFRKDCCYSGEKQKIWIGFLIPKFLALVGISWYTTTRFPRSNTISLGGSR